MENEYSDAVMEIEFRRISNLHKGYAQGLTNLQKQYEEYKHQANGMPVTDPNLSKLKRLTKKTLSHLQHYTLTCGQIKAYKREISVRNPQNDFRATEHAIIMDAYERAYAEKTR